MTNYDKRMSLVVVSCDAYVDIAEYYINFLRLNWSECKNRVIVAMEEKEINGDKVETIVCGANTTWTQRAITAIKNANTPYILLSVDDLFMSEHVDAKEIDRVLDFIEKEKILYYRIPVFKFADKNIPTYSGNENVEHIPSNQRYNVSIGTAIWDKFEILRILGDGTKSAWDLENYFLEQAIIGKPGYIEKYVSDKRFLLHSIHMVKSGRWIPKSVKKMAKLGYNIDYTSRGYISFRDRLKINGFYSWASRKFPLWLRKLVKKLMSFLGFKFTSKN
jgi:hypothetical protein